MLVSTRGRYALRIMMELAKYDRNRYIPLPLIAENQEVSEKYLESIISVLAKAGLVEGLRGKGGGYRLSRELKDYSVGEILRLSEGSLAPVACLDRNKSGCPRAGKMPDAAHVGKAGQPHQRLSGQRFSGGSDPPGR